MSRVLRDRYVVVGHPVEHSRSPAIHARFAELTGEAIHYGRLLAEPGRFVETLQGFAASSAEGLGPARGCNITVPFKFEVPALAARLSPRARLAQAANTLRFEPAEAGGWLADNTDGAGLVRDLMHNAGIDLRGRRLLLVGAGGAAAGAMGPLIDAGLEQLALCNRSIDKAAALVERHAPLAAQRGVELAACALDAAPGGFDIVVNATAASLAGAGVPIAGRVLRAGGVALDMMYGAPARPFLQWAREHGATPRDGLGMLVEQAAEAFLVWRGLRPPTAEVLREQRHALDAQAPVR
ncbi:MAG TPA: shikimate dehydrogenase [Methylibium sp.]|uniref:shikimate dehydrogenase n=1 Tax=Methylibium sp. TaxID=2067992 RepID=UPI002DBFC85F|nr:shikimate dehydrogenase [Methylibium sp.]HEU4457937.1 shikimate dehydrogenase [Methylibium sp.]